MIICEINAAKCRERLSTSMRDYVGPRKLSADNVADQIDRDPRTVRGLLNGEFTADGMVTLLRLFALFGPSFTNRVLHLCGLDGAFKQEIHVINDFELNADLGKTIGDLAQALRDKRVDHSERPRILSDLRVLQADIDNYLALADATPEEIILAEKAQLAESLHVEGGNA